MQLKGRLALFLIPRGHILASHVVPSPRGPIIGTFNRRRNGNHRYRETQDHFLFGYDLSGNLILWWKSGEAKHMQNGMPPRRDEL